VNCYPFIEAEKAGRRNVRRACELLKVSRAAYYAARDGQPSRRDREDAEPAVKAGQPHGSLPDRVRCIGVLRPHQQTGASGPDTGYEPHQVHRQMTVAGNALWCEERYTGTFDY
jgi:hypothetical protein